MAAKLALLFLLCASAHAQIWSSAARRIVAGASLPATCTVANGDVFFKTTATIGIYQCTAANTWSLAASGVSGSSGITCTGGVCSIDATVVGTKNIVTLTSSGTDTYAGTIPEPYAYTAGEGVWLKPDVTNTGAASLNVTSGSALGAKNIKTIGGSDPPSGYLDASKYHLLVYDGTNFVITSDPRPISLAAQGYFGTLGPVLSTTTKAMVANRQYIHQFFVPARMTLSGVLFEVTTGSGTCTGTCGALIKIWDAPCTTAVATTAVLTSGGSPDINTTGGKKAAFTAAVTLDPGVYWMSFASESNVLVMRAHSAVANNIWNADTVPRLAIGDAGSGNGGSFAVAACGTPVADSTVPVAFMLIP